MLTCLDFPRAGDADALLRLFTEAEVREHLGGPLAAAQAARRVEGILADRSGQVQAVRPGNDPAGHEAIGLVWLAPHHEEPDPEFSVMLLPEWQVRGHAFRAGTQVLERAFDELGLSRVVAETRSANGGCIALLERLGMRRESTLWRFGAEQSLFAIRNPRL